jgi:pyrimidine-nucleoside phosphorylase
VEAQGGDVAQVRNPDLLPKAEIVRELPAPRGGYIAALDAMSVGLAAVDLGAGRLKKGDPIDHAVGIVLQRKIGDRVDKGEPLLTVHANDELKLAAAQERLLGAYEWSDTPVAAPPLIDRIIREPGRLAAQQ